MLNLFDYLTELDNKRIENYVHAYGASAEAYCGNAEYLKYWAKCKPHLFHLLGGQLIYKFPVCFEKPQAQIRKDLEKLVGDNEFITHYYACLDDEECLRGDYDTLRHCEALVYADTFFNDATPYAIKIKPDGHQKMLQLQKGMKPIRAILKMIDYFGWEDLRKEYEDFRIAHSMVYNDKQIKGNMCISIHPLDFMTMSDNASGWSSCMSWTDDGCYHIGTVEMMNSNNVICCYIESSDDFNFGENGSDESWHWNNKKWRQLFYVTKDIAVCGKAYPYQHKDFSIAILDKIKELTEKNLGKSYTFGPEPYRDMNHIGSNQRMINNKRWIWNKNTTKHNIIFDTKGMYNDMFNDHYSDNDIYWCYRNKVKHNIVISYSGKAPCICCGGDVLVEEDLEANYEGSYNERYTQVSKVMCENCRAVRRCDMCGNDSGRRDIIEIDGKRLCTDCVQHYLRSCPSCGKRFIARLNEDNQLYAHTNTDELYQQDFYGERKEKEEKVRPLFMCPTCRDKMRGRFAKIKPPINKSEHYYSWRREREFFVSKEPIDITTPEWSKFLFKNLASPKAE